MRPALKLTLTLAAAAACLVLLASAAGSSSTNLQVKSVWIYPFENRQAEVFQKATILQKTATAIKFKTADEQVIEHCGNYTVEN